MTHNIASMDIQYKLETFRTYSPAVAWSGLIKEVANSSKWMYMCSTADMTVKME